MNFEQYLQRGQLLGEGPIACWLMSKGTPILPVYEKEMNTGKGPQLFSINANYVAPDLMAFTPSNGPIFVEAKYKSVFTWHRKTQRWTTGIDLRHYNDYLDVARKTNLPVWLFFFHCEESPDYKDVRYSCPPCCPTGLFVGELRQLAVSENHRSLPLDYSRSGYMGHGSSGMVYWAESSLSRVATKDEVLDAFDHHCLPGRLGGSTTTATAWRT